MGYFKSSIKESGIQYGTGSYLNFSLDPEKEGSIICNGLRGCLVSLPDMETLAEENMTSESIKKDIRLNTLRINKLRNQLY